MIGQKVIITKFVIFADTIATVYYKRLEDNIDRCIPTYDESIIRLAKHTERDSLHIPATIDENGDFKIDFSQDFEGKHEYMVSEVMNE